ncbi:hypothetical protein BX600DRAFT_483813 [Xylariales sp. PMI_506]|nr:hypothetical protein BX600DRAFT_483813 [Xylariales sp. PMI_506]
MTQDSFGSFCASPSTITTGPGFPADRLALLPDDLLRRIFSAVGHISRRDLCNVSRLNKRYHQVADSILYEKIQFNTPQHHVTFSQSLGRRPRRGSLILGLRVDYPGSDLEHVSLEVPDDNPQLHARFDGLSGSISTMSNLEMLDVAVPDTLLRGIGILFSGPFDLACLKSCTLLYQTQDGGYWDLRENIHIFAHPTLETLIIKRAKLDHRGFDFVERPHETALRKLHLIDCDISDDALGDVLDFPSALKEFFMVQAAEPSPELEESSDNIGDYIYALKYASETLESITIDSPSLTGFKALRMREFAMLKTLRLNWDYQLYGKSSRKPRLHSVALPPELETLEFFNELGTDEEVTDLMLYTIQTREIIARNWTRMIVVEGDDRGVPEDIVNACKEHGLKLDIIGHFDEDEGEEGHKDHREEGKEEKQAHLDTNENEPQDEKQDQQLPG